MNLAKAKDFFVTLREIAIIAVFVLLLIVPSFVKTRLIAAGFTKIDMGIAEWEAELKQSKENLQLAEQKVVKMQRELTMISSAVLEHSQGESQGLNPDNRELMDVKLRIDSSANQLRIFDMQLQKSIKRPDFLMEKLNEDKE